MLMLMTEKGVGNGGKVGVEEQWEGTSNWDGVVYDFVGEQHEQCPIIITSCYDELLATDICLLQTVICIELLLMTLYRCLVSNYKNNSNSNVQINLDWGNLNRQHGQRSLAIKTC